MELVNFSFTKDNIGIQFEENYFDLHNCADFSGFVYSLESRSFEMKWRKNVKHATPSFPSEIRITVQDLTNLHIKERDPEIPFTEDNCVSHIGFHPNEKFSSPKVEFFDSYQASADTHLTLNFESGSSIRLLGGKATLRVTMG